MGGTPQGPYGLAPTGQPAQLDPSQPADSAGMPCPFGQQYARIAGVPRRILIQSPVAGAEWLYKHSGPSWLLLRSVVWQLQTSAVAGNRASRLQLKFGTDLVAQFPPSAVQAASLTVVYQASDCGLTSGDPATASVALSNSMILSDNMTIGSNRTNGDVADQYSAIAIFAEEFSEFDWWDE